MIEVYIIVRLLLVSGQWMYWSWLKDDAQDDAVWKACVHPGETNLL